MINKHTVCVVFTTILLLASTSNAAANGFVPVIIDLLFSDDTQSPDQPPEIHPDAGKHLRFELSGDANDPPYAHFLYLPQDYSDDPRVSFPIIIFLHGLGEKGNGSTELARVTRNGPPKMVERGHHFPAIILSPQLTRGVGDWETINAGLGINNSKSIDDLLERVRSQYNVDPNRIYITGLSLGGGGAWGYARRYADKIAAVVPVCGINSGPAGITELANVGVWAFHAFGDTTVSRGSTITQMNRIAGVANGSADGVMFDYPGNDQTYAVSRVNDSWSWQAGAYNASGGLRWTVYPDAMHNSWTRAYNDNGAPDTELWTWLFQQTR